MEMAQLKNIWIFSDTPGCW